LSASKCLAISFAESPVSLSPNILSKYLSQLMLPNAFCHFWKLSIRCKLAVSCNMQYFPLEAESRSHNTHFGSD
ncbi:MAG TPA: hypothetical protein VNE86_03200, partial [Nitrososphaerales archaeon]|nr:hypothetical protein [Nitrososphaerales archaeon]